MSGEILQRESRLPINIVVPVYNAKRVLKKCIDSVIKQSFGEWRLILVDDGSTDGSERICDRYATKYERIEVHHQENQGSTAARQNGIRLCNDNCYILNLDADDYLTPNALKLLYEAANKNDSDMVIASMSRCIGTRISIPIKIMRTGSRAECKTYTNREIIDELYISYFGITKLPPSVAGVLYKSELYKQSMKFPKIVKFFGEDLNVNIRLLPQCNKITLLPDDLYYYRFGGNTSRFMPYYMDDCLAIHELQHELAAKYPMPQDAEYYMAVQLKNEAYEHLLNCRKLGGFTDDKLLAEIERVCNIPQMVRALNHPKSDSSGCKGFREAAAEKRYDDILNLIKVTDVDAPLKKLAKKIISKL